MTAMAPITTTATAEPRMGTRGSERSRMRILDDPGAPLPCIGPPESGRGYPSVSFSSVFSSAFFSSVFFRNSGPT